VKKLVKILAVTILLSIAATSLFAAKGNETAVLRLTAYIPEKTSFNIFEDDVIVTSNANNFSYAVQEWASTRMLLVTAI